MLAPRGRRAACIARTMHLRVENKPHPNPGNSRGKPTQQSFGGAQKAQKNQHFAVVVPVAAPGRSVILWRTTK